ncbi:MAG: NYN domain-containing protein [candidate division WOR-3 bacterium]|uniref:NYN domain-containing protein n=1 Tax=candidate division WOR-3 bacterium TaxID=2052148 RepID=A0A7C3ES87_UNCW3|nr:NYN domain-containing protein [candidate division WOR-3 bacterium]
MNKTGVFVDVQNIQETFERQGKEVRYDAIIRHVITTGNRERENCKFVAFVPYRRDDERRQRLIDALSFQGYRVVSKPVRERPDGTIKANMDIEITLEILSMSDWLDEIVLVTGDGDFVALVDWLSKRGKKVITIGLGRGYTSVELIRACDEYINLEEIEGAVKAQTQNREWETPPTVA